ncbi:hypothetical protein FACS1894156_6920 [Bacteroidia bacterium]|nr:hypothetical protein FACS1894156_6920 [Bacteroidia bacterium]
MESQEQIKMDPYVESMRYLNDAEEILQKTRKEDNLYLDKKYVGIACGVAYKGVLHALDAWLAINDKPIPTKRDKIKRYPNLQRGTVILPLGAGEFETLKLLNNG